jgi:hypothetical protein
LTLKAIDLSLLFSLLGLHLSYPSWREGCNTPPLD